MTPPLRPWQRLSVLLAILFASVTLLAVAVVGLLVYEWQRQAVEEAVGSQLLNIVRTASLLVDPATHVRAHRDADPASLTFAAAHTAKQQCINTCRARYRDCLSLKQIPSSECPGHLSGLHPRHL